MLCYPDLLTYGAEHEFADWDKRQGVPVGCMIDKRDITIVNSNGIAVDPSGKIYPYGGEINTPPTETPRGQCDVLRGIKAMHPEAKINYRSNLHVHVRVPGLKEGLHGLKTLQRYNLKNITPALFRLIEKIPKPHMLHYKTPQEFRGAMARYERRHVSHQTALSRKIVRAQLAAKTPEEFFIAEAPWDPRRKRPLYHLQPRPAVNVRQLLETDTVEFRHFPGTLDEEELLTAVEWCKEYLLAAFNTNEPAIELFHRLFAGRKWPKFRPYTHWMEVIYKQTIFDGSIPKHTIEARIRRILKGEDISGMSREPKSLSSLRGSPKGKRRRLPIKRVQAGE